MNNPLFIDTPAGRIHVGATVRHHTRSAQGTGLVTEIRPFAGTHRIEVNGRHSDVAELYELLAEPEPIAQAIIDQHAQGVTSGAFEVYVPREQDRIFFAETPAQVVALLARLIGVLPSRVQEETDRIARAAQAGKCSELSFRGSFGTVGQLAYVSTGQGHPLPKFRLNDRVTFYSGGEARTVSGILLCKSSYGPQAGKPAWHYYYAEQRQAFPMPEHGTAPAAPH